MQSTLPIGLAAPDLSSYSRMRAGKASLSIGATAFVALCAHVSVPLFFTPVPLTLQTMAVILVGLTLGPILGFAAMVIYLVEGALGLPVFSPHGPGGIAQLMGPAGGFLFSYPIAAAIAGGVVRAIRRGRSPLPAAVLAGVAASVVFFIIGAVWLSHLMHLNASTAWQLAVAPFLPGEVLKITAAAGAYSTLRKSYRS
jgi:biotin transport system substrate-specific component